MKSVTGDQDKADHGSMRAIAATGAALLALWALSWWMSTFDLGPWALAVAIAVAALKATLVALVFMELAGAALSVKLTLVTAGALAITLGGFMIADVMTR